MVDDASYALVIGFSSSSSLWWRLGFPFIFLICNTSGKGMCEVRMYVV